MLNDKRTCCYPGSGDACTKANIAAHKEAQASAKHTTNRSHDGA
jgi:hypothetical protein